MKITLNGDCHDVADTLTLEMLLQANGFGGKRVAVEVNRQIIPRSMYSEHAIRTGDRIEIVHAIGGG
ncbi:MAG: sulfur carrier protein ThiS [Xanthomonadales bacterium]|nr:sulfur carrier protein ThiS [Xanthomonadales bacterium]